MDEMSVSSAGKNVVVTGATGFIGRALIEILLKKGYSVTVITRNKKSNFFNNSAVKILQTDICYDDFDICSNTNTIFHCAGVFANQSNTYLTNTQGTMNVIKAAVRAGVKNIIYLSSVGVMGVNRAGVFNENTACCPCNEYEKSKLEAERILFENAQKYAIQVVVLRPSIVFGTGKKVGNDTFLSLIKTIKHRRFVYIGSSKAIYNIVYCDDVAEALVYLADSIDVLSGKIFTINDFLTWEEFIGIVYQELKLPIMSTSVPMFLGKMVGYVGDALNKVAIKFPFTSTRYHALTNQTIFSDQKLKNAGFFYKTGSRQGIVETIRFYAKNNLL